MPTLSASPDTLHDTLDLAKPGDTIRLTKGIYGKLRLKSLQGRADAPITIDGDPDCVFDGKRRYEDFHDEANAIAAQEQQDRNYPSLGRYAFRGHLRLKNCHHIRLRGFSVKGCWPTGLYLNNCTGIDIENLTMQEGTFAIFVDGRRSRDIRVRGCSWEQDRRIWSDIDWSAIHGAQAVKATDARGLDGDFFRAFGISGNVIIENNDIRHAFNAVHLYHSDRAGLDRSENRNVIVRNNRFSFIRDNAVEPEWGGWNWWIYHNDIYNCHKWFSLEMERSGHIYIFGNTGWFDSIPGPEGDDNTGGAVFKLPKHQRVSEGMHYIFNNSWFLRAPIIKKKMLQNLWHFNNAVEYADTGSGVLTGRDGTPNFAKDWRRLNIRFFNDCIAHPDYPKHLMCQGFALEPGHSENPGFRDAARGDFGLRAHAAARGKGLPEELALSDGSPWTLPSQLHLGAHQDQGRIAPPPVIPGFATERAFIGV